MKRIIQLSIDIIVEDDANIDRMTDEIDSILTESGIEIAGIASTDTSWTLSEYGIE